MHLFVIFRFLGLFINIVIGIAAFAHIGETLVYGIVPLTVLLKVYAVIIAYPIEWVRYFLSLFSLPELPSFILDVIVILNVLLRFFIRNVFISWWGQFMLAVILSFGAAQLFYVVQLSVVI